MKTIITTILCACLLLCQLNVNAEGPSKERQVSQPVAIDPSPNLVLVCGFVLACVAVGAYIIWKVHSSTPCVGCKVTLALDKTYDWATWTPVCTNTVILTNSDWLVMFQQQMTDSCAFYRVRKVN